VTFLFAQLKTKLEGCHYDTIEVIEAKLQSELITLTKHNFQEALKTAEVLGTLHMHRR
jgi:hypothetical protein